LDFALLEYAADNNMSVVHRRFIQDSTEVTVGSAASDFEN
jgi:hypothetical protein